MAVPVIIFLIFLLSTPVFGPFTQVGRYEELQFLGNPCYPKDTCQSLNEITEDHLWRNRTCECGEHCVRHRTCCIDSNFFGINQFVPKRSAEVCQKVQTRDFKVYMVSTCLDEWQKSFTYEKCVHPENELKDPMSQVPATSIESMNSYRNYFCALCNNDADSAVLWDIGVKMPSNLNLGSNTITTRDDIIQKMEYNSRQSTWGYFYVDPETRQRQFQKLQIKFSVKEDLKKFVKPCHPRIISKCSSSYKSTRLRYKCEAYYSPIRGQKQFSEDFLIYRNIHCALCNGLRANIDEFACLARDIRKGISLSFTKLLDVNRNDGDNVGMTKVCKDGQAFDPFFKKCRSLVCAMPNHVKKNGACVKSD